MKFTGQEMICFNSMIDREDIFGIKIDAPPFGDKSSYIDQTQKSLREKGILDQQNQLTKEGIFPIRLLESYKRANAYLFINHLRIGLVSDDKAVVLGQMDQHYILTYLPKLIVLEQLLKEYSFLRHAQEQNGKYEHQYLEEDVFYKTIDEEHPKEVFLLLKFKNDQLRYQKTYFGKEKLACSYNYLTKKYMTMGSRDARMELMKLLELRA